MNKQLLFVFLSTFAINHGLMAQEEAAKLTLLSELGEYTRIYLACKDNFNENCNFLVKHLHNAYEFESKKDNISFLKQELKHVKKEPALLAQIENDLTQARIECPNFREKYWQTLSPDEQEKIASAASAIIHSTNNLCDYAWELNRIHTVLQK